MSSKTLYTLVWIFGFSVICAFFNFAFGPVGAMCESKFNLNFGFSCSCMSTSTGLEDMAMSWDNSNNLILFFMLMLYLEFNKELLRSTICGISKFSADQCFGAS